MSVADRHTKVNAAGLRTFNLRHQRVGHLFQKRYKSIICEDDSYLLELIRYIHLNPVRAGLVTTEEGLLTYPWSGHAAVMGERRLAGHDTAEVLSRFGDDLQQSRQKYRAFVIEGMEEGHREEFAGGGMLRSSAITGTSPGEEASDCRIHFGYHTGRCFAGSDQG